MGYLLKQSSTARPLLFLLVDSADHIAGKTGATPTVTISKNGAAFASPAGAVTELSGGWYKVAGNATDTDTAGPLLLHATASGADPCDESFEVVAFDPSDATRLGLSALPNAAAGANGGLPVLSSSATTLAYTVGTVTTLTNLPAAPTDWVTAASVSAAAVTKVQAGLSTYAGADTSGTTTLLSRLTGVRAGYLDNINNVTLAGASFPTDPADQSLVIAATDAIIGRLGTPAGASVSADVATVKTDTAAIKTKTDNLPASPAAVGSAMTLADGAITDAKVTLPTEASGTPSTFLQLVMWVAGQMGWRKVVKDASNITQYMADGTTTKTSSAYTSIAGTDTINKAS